MSQLNLSKSGRDFIKRQEAPGGNPILKPYYDLSDYNTSLFYDRTGRCQEAYTVGYGHKIQMGRATVINPKMNFWI